MWLGYMQGANEVYIRKREKKLENKIFNFEAWEKTAKIA